MTTTYMIARILGPVYAVIGLALIMNPHAFRAIVDDFAASPAIRYIGAFLALLFGSAVLATHWVWSGWPAIITLLGVAGFIKGASLVLAPEPANARLTRLVAHDGLMRAWGVVALVGGFALAYAGYGGPA